ncbi:MAG: toprim domain-containing protein [Planctomycetota bacterium]
MEEGYTDVISCHQVGICHAVATLGTALTEGHAAMLRRLCDTVIVLFDGDEAGQRAADRAFEVFFKAPVDVKVATLPPGDDPDTLLKQEGGVERFQQMIETATDAFTHRFERLEGELRASGRAIGSEGRTRAVETFLDRLVELGLHDLSFMRQSAAVRRLASLGGVGEEAVRRSMKTRRVRTGGSSGASSDATTERVEPKTAPEHALGCLLADPRLAEISRQEAADILDPGLYASGPIRSVVEQLAGMMDRGESIALDRLDGASERAVAIAFARSVESITDGVRLQAHFEESCRGVQRRRHATPAGAGDDDAMTVRLRRLEEEREARRRDGGIKAVLPRPSA